MEMKWTDELSITKGCDPNYIYLHVGGKYLLATIVSLLLLA